MVGVEWTESWSCGEVWKGVIGPFRLNARETGLNTWRCMLMDREQQGRVLFEETLSGETVTAETARATCETAVTAELDRRGWYVERLAASGLVCVVRPQKDLPPLKK